MEPTYVGILMMVGIAIGYFGSLILKVLSNDTEIPKKALCLSKEKENERLKVFWDGKEVPTASTLTYEQRNQVQNLALELNNWLGISVAPAAPRPAAVASEPLPFKLPAPILFTSSGANPPSVPPASALPAASIPLPTVIMDEPEEQPLTFSINPVKVIQNVMEKDKTKAPAGSKSIIAQVDAILQRKIVGTPFEKRGIRLLEKPDHTMLIEVGLNKYDGIDTIPSGDVRDLIRACVAEWTALSIKK